MVLKTDQARIKALLKDTITLLCRNGLTFKTEFSIEALIGITLDKDDVVLVSINEVIRSELGAKLAAAQSSGQDPGIENATWNEESDEDPNGSIDVRRQHSPSVKRRRKRRRSTGRVSVTEETGEQDEGGEDDRSSISQLEDADDNSIHSEPPIKRTPGDATKNRNSIKEEYREEDDESKDIVFIKEEVDNWPSTGGGHGQDNFSDLSGIPSTSSQQEGFDFLQGGLLPVASQGAGASMWPELSHHQGQQSGHPSSGMGAAAKRTPTNTSSAMGSNADDSQQTYGQTICFLAGSVGMINSSPDQRKIFTCNVCSRTLTTRRGFEAHMGQHLGIFRYRCESCGKGFPSTTALRDHERSHTGKKLMCPVCIKQFASAMGLKHHMKSVHGLHAHGIFGPEHGMRMENATMPALLQNEENPSVATHTGDISDTQNSPGISVGDRPHLFFPNLNESAARQEQKDSEIDKSLC